MIRRWALAAALAVAGIGLGTAWAGSLMLLGVGGVGNCGFLTFDQTSACNFIAVPLVGM